MSASESIMTDASQFKAMIVDDDDSTRHVMAIQLRDWDCTFFGSREELFEKLTPAYTVLLLDINLFGRNTGGEILKEIRQDPNYRKLRIIAFTAYAMPGQEAVFLEQGFDGYIAKPYHLDDLLAVLRGDRD